MAFLQIPDRFRGVLPLLGSLTDDQLHELERALSSAPKAAYSDDFSSLTAKKISFLDIKEARLLVDAVMALYLAKCNSNISGQHFSNDVHDSLLTGIPSEDKAKNIQSFDPIKFTLNLNRILSIPSFDLAAKATGLITENEKNYSVSRVISDIRYIFSPGENFEKIIGGVLIHKLKIEYFENDRLSEIFISLDLEELNELLLNVQRAILKDKILREKFSEIQFIE